MKLLIIPLAAIIVTFLPICTQNFPESKEVPVKIQHETFILKSLINLAKSPNTVIVSGMKETDKSLLGAITKSIKNSIISIVGIREEQNSTEQFQLVKKHINSLIEKRKLTDVIFISTNNDENIISNFIIQVAKCYQNKLLHFILLSGSKSAKIVEKLQPHLYEEMNLVLLILMTKYISCYQVLVNRQGVSCLRYLGREKPDSSETCKNLSFLHDKFARYKDFNGRTLTLSALTVVRPVFLGFKNASDISVNIAGFDVPHIKILEEKFNFRTQFIFTVTGNNQLRLIFDRKADFTIKAHYVYERLRYVEFCFPHYIDSYILLMKVPKELPKTTVLFRPFSPMIWAIVIGTIVAIGISFGVFFVFVDFTKSRKKTFKCKYLFSKLGSGLWYSFVVLMEETTVSKLNKAIKFLSLLWSILSLVITVIYSGLLFSYLSNKQTEAPIDTLQDVEMAVKHKGWILAAAPHSGLSSVFEKAKSGFCKRMWDIMKHHNWGVPFPKTFDQQDSVDKVMTVLTRFVLTEKFMLYNSYKYRTCKEPILTMMFGTAVRKGSPYQDLLSETHARLNTHGILQYLRDRVVKPKFHIEKPNHNPLSLQHLQSGFLVLVFGLSLASLIFLCKELKIWKRRVCSTTPAYQVKINTKY